MPTLLIVGASVRAAAFSARRAGFRPVGLDLFADRDLRRLGDVTRISRSDYPHRLGDFLKRLPEGPWMYTGGLENYPQLIGSWAQHRPLWGCLESCLRRVRSPQRLAQCLRSRDLCYPPIRNTPPPIDDPNRWLMKPLRGAGGTSIIPWSPTETARRKGVYFQRLVEGVPKAAIFNGRHGKAELLGVTEQIIGPPWLHARPFAYCGSIGPIELDAGQRGQWERIGQALVEDAGLVGLFGVDAVEHDGQIDVVEVNPRYTASIEVLEYATGLQALRHHAAAFDSNFQIAPGERNRQRMIGKAILFAPQGITFPADGPWEDESEVSVDSCPRFADVPVANSLIERGGPILTVFAEGQSVEIVRGRLRESAEDCYRCLGLC